MSFSEEITTLRLPGFRLVNLSTSRNPFFVEFPEARNYAGEIRGSESDPDPWWQIESDFTRGKEMFISGQSVTSQDVIDKFRACVGGDVKEIEKVARAYSQSLAEAVISPLSNLECMPNKPLFSNLFKNTMGQIYFAICRHSFDVGGVNAFTDLPNLNIPGEVLYIYAYNPNDGQFHLKHTLVSNDLLK